MKPALFALLMTILEPVVVSVDTGWWNSYRVVVDGVNRFETNSLENAERKAADVRATLGRVPR